MPRVKASLVQILLHIGVLLPLLILAWDYTQGQLTANPIQEIQRRTGRYALLLLTLSLACTPIHTLTGLRLALQFRRPLGLYAFMYACLHLLNFVGLDYGFNLAFLREDISGKRYIAAGFAAFLILLALAMTSTRGWMGRLRRNWERLHQLVYAAGLLAVIHYLWQAKVGIRAPFVYGIIILVLLVLRIPAINQRVAQHLRRREKG